MRLPIAYYGDPVLRKKCARVEEINDDIRTLIQDMIDTLDAEDGIGLAAPQVSRSVAIFLVRAPIPSEDRRSWNPGVLRIFINPKILAYSDQQWETAEACISIPGLEGKVARPVQVAVETTDMEGKRMTLELFGYEARIFMHENDHINGVLFVDRVKGKERQALEPLLREIKKKYHPGK